MYIIRFFVIVTPENLDQFNNFCDVSAGRNLLHIHENCAPHLTMQLHAHYNGRENETVHFILL